jgi:thioredoxin-related protein
MLKTLFPLSLIAAAVLLVACNKPSNPPATLEAPATAASAASTAAAQPDHPANGIAWHAAANDAEVDAAFALAKAEHKPVFVYWGAKWCPPCNQVKATLFNRVDFIERSRAFVPVYIDGDSPGAQKLGSRFKVRGYPTMVLFNTDGAELTRLPGEVDAQQYTQVLTLGMNAQRPVKSVLADAKKGGAGLTANDWRLLAFYSWETDEQQVPPESVPALLKQLAAACPADQAETASRLLLKSVAASEEKGPKPDATARDKVLKLLADTSASRAQMDVLTNYAADIVKALHPTASPQRVELIEAFNSSLKRLEADTTLSRADRLTALQGRVDLARIDAAKDAIARLPEPLLAEVREHVARDDREISDGYERQAVITAAAYMLERAGLLDESDTLLKASLAKSHSPYYLMSQLSGNAKKRGNKAEAVRWAEEAFNKSEGPATRLQWGSTYVNALVELAPQEEARIEKAAAQLLDEAAAQPNAFYERSARSLQKVGSKLQGWNKDRAHAPVLARLQTKLDGVCAKLPAGDPQRGVCEGLFKPAEAAKKSA